MGEYEIIVDEDDQPVGSRHWNKIQPGDIQRASALWLTDTKSDDILIAQRKWSKKNDPGLWGAAAAGTNEVDDTYESNMIKEIQEEIGLSNLNLTSGPKIFVSEGGHQFFCQWFLASIDKDKVQLKLQPEEVEAAKWVPKTWLINDVKRNPGNYVPSMPETLKALGYD